MTLSRSKICSAIFFSLSFFSVAHASTLLDSYSETNVDSSFDMYVSSPGEPASAQIFTTPSSPAYTLSSAKFYIKNNHSKSCNTYAELFDYTGSVGTTAVPTGSALATSDVVDSAGLTTSYQLITFNFSTPYTLAVSTSYAISYRTTCTYAGDSYLEAIGKDQSSPGHAGNAAHNDGSWTAYSTNDLAFYVYGNEIMGGGGGGGGATTTGTTTDPLNREEVLLFLIVFLVIFSIPAWRFILGGWSGKK